MKSLLILTAVIEVGTGLALLVSPSEVVTLLVGSALDTDNRTLDRGGVACPGTGLLARAQ